MTDDDGLAVVLGDELVVLGVRLDVPLVVALEEPDDVDVAPGGDEPPSLQPATSAPPSTATTTNPTRRECTSFPFAVHGTAAANAADRMDSTDIGDLGHFSFHRTSPHPKPPSISVASSTSGFDNRPLCSSHD